MAIRKRKNPRKSRKTRITNRKKSRRMRGGGGIVSERYNNEKWLYKKQMY